MARRSPPRKVTYFEPALPRLARNTIIESTFEIGHRFRCTMRVDSPTERCSGSQHAHADDDEDCREDRPQHSSAPTSPMPCR
jgi:hypothetical protein